MADMKRESIVCVNHAGTPAKRKCFQCLSPICPACQRRALGHIFCSFRCQVRCWASDQWDSWRRFLLRVSLRYRKLERSTQRMTGGGLFRLLSLGLLLFLLYQTSLLVSTLQEISLPQDGRGSFPALPTADIVHEGDWITVAGGAPGYGVAVLLADGKERDTCTVSEGRFSFTFQLTEPVKSVQVQVYGDRMPTVYTRAMPLPETASAAEAVPSPSPAPPLSPVASPATPKGEPPPAVSKPERKPGKKTPSVPNPLADLSRGVPETGRVAITFDGGSYSNSAGRILDVLAERGLKATFFLTGEFMNHYPQVTKRIASDGHEVGNHMYSHLHLTTFEKDYRQDTLPGVGRDLVIKELLRNEKLFEDLTGKKMVKLWRAPYGEQNEEIRQWALQAGYRHVSWTYDPKTRKSLDGLDWVSDRASTLFLSSDQIVEKILSFDTDTELGLAGGIVLLHLGSERKSDPFHQRLGELIDRLQERGYKVGSVSQMLETGG